MKHILPILTLALLGAATTVSATGFFDDYVTSNGYAYYDSAKVGDVEKTDTGEVWGGQKVVTKSQEINYGNYQVIKTNDPTTEGANSLEYNSHYRIRVTQNNVDFYLFDFIDSVDEDPEKNPNENAIKNAGIKRIGYRILNTGTNLERAGEESTRSLDRMEKDPAAEIVDHETAGLDYDVTRNKYYLGTFNAGEEFEIYMSYINDSATDSGVWSYSTTGFYGGYYGGENEQPFVNVDTLMAAYKAQNFDFEYGKNGLTEAEVAKAMPFATLSPNLNSTPTQVIFGIQAVGSPLPGGLPVALIASLFGLGFWYLHRRKAATA